MFGRGNPLPVKGGFLIDLSCMTTETNPEEPPVVPPVVPEEKSSLDSCGAWSFLSCSTSSSFLVSARSPAARISGSERVLFNLLWDSTYRHLLRSLPAWEEPSSPAWIRRRRGALVVNFMLILVAWNMVTSVGIVRDALGASGRTGVRNVLGPSQKKKLDQFLKPKPILVFDYDGTLAPIVRRATQAQMRPRTRRLLMRLCEHSVCVLLSGRARQDVLEHVRGIPFSEVVGNHGARMGVLRPGDKTLIGRAHRWYQSLKTELGGLQGVQIEDKCFSLSVHFRHARRKKFAEARILESVARLRGLRLIGGKQVFNLLPREIAGKGQALVELKKLHCSATAIYVGDDLTDEEVFRLPEGEGVFKIRVGKSEISRADYFIPSQKDIDTLLEALC